MKKKIRFSKQIISVLLCIAMLMSYVPAFSITASAASGEETCDESGCSGVYENGFCTECDDYEEPEVSPGGVYYIANAGNLYWFANYVNTAEDGVLASACLTADIVVNEQVLGEDGTYTVYYTASALNHNDKAGSFTVTVDKATITEPTIVSKSYTGSAQSADIVDTDLYTVEQNNGGTAKGNYNVVLKLKDVDNYKWATTDNTEVTLTFVISAAENAWTVAPSISGWTYGETAKAPTHEAKFGTVNVTYTGKANDGSDYSSETAPTKAGNYTATFTVASTEDYSGLSESVNFTIAKAIYDMSSAKWNYTDAFKYDGKEHKVEVVGLPNGVAVGYYNGNTAIVVGDYTAKATLTYDANNYNTPSVADLNWKVENDWTPSEFTVNGDGWMNQDFVITASDGYKVSLTNTSDGEWSDTLTASVEGENSIKFYLKNEATGEISLEKSVTYKLDKNTEATGTTGKVYFDERNGWETFLNTISFGLFYKDEVTVKAEANDNLSGVECMEYVAFSEAKTLDEVKAIADSEWKEMPTNGVAIAVEDAKKFVYFVRITDKAGNVTYLSTDSAEYDTTVPAISGVESGKTYYTTQKVIVMDTNLITVTLNGELVTGTITLDGNKDSTYTIVATDKAGNTTTVTVTMKPISDLSAPIDTLDKDNVNSSDEQVVEGVKEAVAAVDTTYAADDEKTALKEIADKAEGLLETIDEADKATNTENTEKVKDVTAENVTPEDKTDLEKAKDDLEKSLEDYGGNYTDDEKKAIEDEIKHIDDALEVLGKVENVEEKINDLPKDISEEAEEELMMKAETSQSADAVSPNTGDNSILWLWIALLFVSGSTAFRLTSVAKKRK